jgi:ABC-2 type transport system permease protein
MSKLFRLIYVNLLSLFDINKIIIARKNRVKTSLETRTTILGILSIAYGYLMYSLLLKLKLDNQLYYVCFGYVGSFLFCLLTDMFIVEAILFSNKDNDLLFSLPITKNQLVFAKLFTIYLRNIFFVVIIMLATLLAYTHGNKVDDTFVLMHILITLFIPFIPIVICSLLAYINDYYKIKLKPKKFYSTKIAIIAFVVWLLIIIFRNQNSIDAVMMKINYVLPFNYLFYITLKTENFFLFLLMMLIPVLFIYLYNQFMSNNIMRLCSLLEGVNKNTHFDYKIGKKLGKLSGFIRKEICNLFKYKAYLFNSFAVNVVFFIGIIIILNIIDIDIIKKIRYFDFYFNLYGPCLIGMINSLSVSTVSSISLEKDNLMMIKSMPIDMNKVLAAKWLTNIIIAIGFIIIEASLVSIYFGLNIQTGVFWFLVPFFILAFVSLTGLVLDYRFVDRVSKSDNAILRQRLIVIVPTFLSLIIGFIPTFFLVSLKYKLFLGSCILGLSLLMVIELLYMKMFKKKLEDGLTK